VACPQTSPQPQPTQGAPKKKKESRSVGFFGIAFLFLFFGFLFGRPLEFKKNLPKKSSRKVFTKTNREKIGYIRLSHFLAFLGEGCSKTPASALYLHVLAQSFWVKVPCALG
jgi:hypothetical protein